MSRNPKKINIIRTNLLRFIDKEIKTIKIIDTLPSLNKSTLDFQNNILIEMKEYSHSLQKIMRGFDTFFKGNQIIQFKRKEKTKISNSTKYIPIIKNNEKLHFRYLEDVCSMVKIPIKSKRSKTEINSVLKIKSNDLILNQKNNERNKKLNIDIILKM